MVTVRSAADPDLHAARLSTAVYGPPCAPTGDGIDDVENPHECRADGAGPGGVVIGVQAMDRVLLAADTRTTRDGVVESDAGGKLWPVHPSAAIGSTAEPGDVDSLVTRLRREVDRYEYHHSR